ncbi:MAG: DNA polymerase I, partial [Clostridia bacterium]|nr:DNA polymerase I [Clostridia bacterium]
STDADILGAIRHRHPIVDAVLKFRQITKLRSTYAQGLLRAADERGFIHSDFKQAATLTGRLSSAEPNLQNIPIRTELGSRFRKHFITKSEDYLLIDTDYSQIELRLLAHMAGDEAMIAAYREGADIHTRTAAAAFRVPESEVTPELRSRAKAVSFGIVYGISAFSLAGDLAISVKEASDYMEAYFAEFPRVKGYLESAVAGAEETGYTETLFGRRRYIPELTASQYPVRQFGKRVAMNSPIQGTAADIIKRAMIAVHRRLREEGLDAHLILQVHDELIVEAHKKDAERAARILREEMEGAAELSVPLTVEVTEGAAWLTD